MTIDRYGRDARLMELQNVRIVGVMNQASRMAIRTCVTRALHWKYQTRRVSGRYRKWILNFQCRRRMLPDRKQPRIELDARCRGVFTDGRWRDRRNPRVEPLPLIR